MEFYVARGICGKDKRFDPSQIEEGLALGLLPQIILPGWTNEEELHALMDGLYEYTSKRSLGELPMKITAHGKGEFTELVDIKRSISTLTHLNKLAGRHVIGEVVFHAGAVHTFEEELSKRQGKKFQNVDCTFKPEDLSATFEAVKQNVERVRELASGIDVLVENVGQVNYDFSPDFKSEEPRWAGTGWRPGMLQLGDVGCGWDLLELGNVCIDAEHLKQTVEYSGFFNPTRVDTYSMAFFKPGRLFLKHGMPIVLEEELSHKKLLEALKGKVKVCHLGGQTNMVFNDIVDGAEVPKIGSHMPIYFPGDNNPYVHDTEIAKKMALNCEDWMNQILPELVNAGCSKGVLELQFGPYTGKEWQMAHEISKKNVESVLKSV